MKKAPIHMRMVLGRPMSGYWDDDMKSPFHFQINGHPQHDARGAYIRIGSWEANHWFHVAMGKTVKATLGNARRRLTQRFRHAGQHPRFMYIESVANYFERQTFGT